MPAYKKKVKIIFYLIQRVFQINTADKYNIVSYTKIFPCIDVTLTWSRSDTPNILSERDQPCHYSDDEVLGAFPALHLYYHARIKNLPIHLVLFGKIQTKLVKRILYKVLFNLI